MVFIIPQRTATTTAAMSEEKQMPVVAMDSLEDDDIFYSDDESSDESEDTSSTGWSSTDYLGSNNLFYNKNELQVDAKSCTNFFNQNAINKIVNPVDQISTGMTNLLNEVASSRPMPSYSAITRKSPTSEPPKSVKPPTIKPRPQSTSPITTTNSSTPYRFVSKNPVADPRYSPEQQLMLGPIPGHLDHDNIYNSLRGFFQQRGPVQFMFIHKGAVKIQSSGDKTVKFGYVVFTKKGPAQAILKEGTVTFAGHSIKVRPMEK